MKGISNIKLLEHRFKKLKNNILEKRINLEAKKASFDVIVFEVKESCGERVNLTIASYVKYKNSPIIENILTFQKELHFNN